jgi:sulfoxide reductase catalytic subunit YedY
MKSNRRIKSWEITSESNYRNRRQFIRDAGLAIGGGVLTSTLPVAAMAAERDLVTVPGPFSTAEQPNSWRDVTTYNNFYEFGTGKEDPYQNAQDFQPRPWSVRVSGECGKPGDYDYEDIISPHTLEDRVCPW